MQYFQSIFSKVGFINNIKIFPYVKIVYFKVYYPTLPHPHPTPHPLLTLLNPFYIKDTWSLKELYKWLWQINNF